MDMIERVVRAMSPEICGEIPLCPLYPDDGCSCHAAARAAMDAALLHLTDEDWEAARPFVEPDSRMNFEAGLQALFGQVDK